MDAGGKPSSAPGTSERRSSTTRGGFPERAAATALGPKPILRLRPRRCGLELGFPELYGSAVFLAGRRIFRKVASSSLDEKAIR